MSNRIKIKEEFARSNIISICSESELEFLGWVSNKWVGVKTKLILECKKHNFKWETTTYSKFTKKNKPSRCGICNGRCLNEHTAKRNVEKLCSDLNLLFLGWSEGNWIGTKTKLILWCDEHKYKNNTINYESFLRRKKGCKVCSGFIINKYTASKLAKNKCVEYGYEFIGFVNDEWIGVTETYLILKCPKHIIWESTTYDNFVNNNRKCPMCNQSKQEKEIAKILEYNNINHKKIRSEFNWLKNPTTNHSMEVDFYLPEYNIAIECQGIQHFQPIRFGGLSLKRAKENLIETQYRDRIKKQLCEENGVKLYYINYNDNVEERLNKILKENKILLYSNE